MRRIPFRGNGRDQNGQYRGGFASIHDEGRRDIRLELPPDMEPSRYSDWSSIASPPARTSPLNAPDVRPAQNQLTVPVISETRQERDEVGTSEGNTIAPQMDVLTENQNIPARPTLVNIETRTQRNETEPNEENVDIIPPTPIRSTRSSLSYRRCVN